VKNFVIVSVAVAGTGYLLWRYWQQINADNAQVWAAGTDRVV